MIEKTEHFKVLRIKYDNSSAIANCWKTAGHNIKWDIFDILASGPQRLCSYMSLTP